MGKELFITGIHEMIQWVKDLKPDDLSQDLSNKKIELTSTNCPDHHMYTVVCKHTHLHTHSTTHPHIHTHRHTLTRTCVSEET